MRHKKALALLPLTALTLCLCIYAVVEQSPATQPDTGPSAPGMVTSFASSVPMAGPDAVSSGATQPDPFAALDSALTVRLGAEATSADLRDYPDKAAALMRQIVGCYQNGTLPLEPITGSYSLYAAQWPENTPLPEGAISYADMQLGGEDLLYGGYTVYLPLKDGKRLCSTFGVSKQGGELTLQAWDIWFE